MRVIWSGTFISENGSKYIEVNRVVDGKNVHEILDNCHKQRDIQSRLGLTLLYEKIVYVDKGDSDDRSGGGFRFLL